MVSLPLAGRVDRTQDDATASSGVEVGVGVPRATALVAPPPDRPSAGHPPRKGEGKKRYSDAATLAPPFDTATKAGRSTRSPMV